MSQLADRPVGPARTPRPAVAGRPLVPTPADRRWPSVQRPDEAAQIRSALADRRSVIVVGEAGVGKTHLVDQVLTAGVPHQSGPTDGPGPRSTALWEDRETVTLSASSLGPDMPLGALHPRLATLLGRVTGERVLDAARLGPWDGGDRPAGATATPSGPLVVRIEDAHLLDPSSAEHLAHLARQGRLQLVLTMRTAAASTSPWLGLWKDGVATRIDLRSLTTEEVDSLLAVALGGPMTVDTSNRIWAETLGNPFYVRELVRNELSEGVLVEKDGVWVGLVGTAPSRRVTDVVRSDVGRLEPAIREALDLVALAEPIPVSRLVNLVQDGALDLLAHEGLITVGQGSRPEEGLTPTVRIAHPTYAEALRRLVPLDRRRRLFAAMRAVRQTPGGLSRETPASLLRSVVWALECGIRETPERLQEAMRVATDLNRPDVTVQVGFVALSELAPTHPARADVLLLRADAWRLLDQPARALRDLAEVPQLLGEPGTPTTRERSIRLASLHADVDQYHRDDPDAALAAIEELRSTMPGSGADGLPVLEVSRLVHLGRAGRFTECVEPSLELLRGRDLSVDVLRLANPMVFGLGQAGRFDEALHLAETTSRAAAAHSADVPWLAAEIEVAHFAALIWAGEVETAVDLLEPRDAVWARLSASDAFGNLGRGLLAAAHGQWSDAVREHHAASARYAVLDPAGVGAYAIAAEAVAVAAVGDVVAARRLIDRAQQAPLRMSSVIESDVRLHLLDAMAWLQQPTLHTEAMILARWCAERGLHRTELEALHRSVLAGHLRGATSPADGAVLARMREIGRFVDRSRPRALVAHAEALLTGDDQLAQVAARDLSRCGLWLPTAGAGSDLTRREREIAALAAGGLSSRAIAERLTVSVRTVDSHLSRVFTKLGLRSRQELGSAMR